jgi:hypothetical protein
MVSHRIGQTSKLNEILAQHSGTNGSKEQIAWVLRESWVARRPLQSKHASALICFPHPCFGANFRIDVT